MDMIATGRSRVDMVSDSGANGRPVHNGRNSEAKMPDIAEAGHNGIGGTLDHVGMANIEVPVRLPGGIVTPARGAAFVSLDDPDAKGIHMSRLFLALQEHLESEELAPGLLRRILDRFIASHAGLSLRARVALDFDLMLLRPALKSDNRAWRSYPVSMLADLGPEGFRCELAVQVTYSSTCPCSAALARQLIQERFDRDFAGRSDIAAGELRSWLGTEQAICATPHSQRSHADVRIALVDGARIEHRDLIDAVEDALKTPVQAAVKRADEQESARLNGENLMFCEDAGRRVAHALDGMDVVADYHVRASHLGSLHPHDAVSVVTKGVDGGFKA